VKGILNKKSKKLSLKKRCTKKNQRFEQNFETLRWNKEIKSTAKKPYRDFLQLLQEIEILCTKSSNVLQVQSNYMVLDIANQNPLQAQITPKHCLFPNTLDRG
jgi:hypothetical protein